VLECLKFNVLSSAYYFLSQYSYFRTLRVGGNLQNNNSHRMNTDYKIVNRVIKFVIEFTKHRHSSIICYLKISFAATL